MFLSTLYSTSQRFISIIGLVGLILERLDDDDDHYQAKDMMNKLI